MAAVLILGLSALEVQSADAKVSIESMERYQREAMALPAEEVFRAFLKSASALHDEQERAGKAFVQSENALKGAGYLTALDKMYEAGDRDAAYYVASYHKLLCLRNKQAAPTDPSAADECFKYVTDRLKFAAEGDDPRAMRVLAEFSEKGHGTVQSKLAAVEWLIKAALASIYLDDLDRAYEDVEKALTLIPDHPRALVLRASILDEPPSSAGDSAARPKTR